MRPIFIIDFCQFGSLFQVTSYTFVNITSLNYSGREERVLKEVCLALKQEILSILFHVLYTALVVMILSNR